MVPPKPPRKGKTCRVPKGRGAELTNDRRYKTTAAERRRKNRERRGLSPESANAVKVTVPIEQYLIREHTTLRSCKDVNPEFRDRAVEERKRRKAERQEADGGGEQEGGAQRAEDQEEDNRGKHSERHEVVLNDTFEQCCYNILHHVVRTAFRIRRAG